MIRYLKHSQIDKEKWDWSLNDCINKMIYAQSWYLDKVSPSWDALILGDYEQLMPLPQKRKFAISYLIQPAYTQQLGVFSQHLVDNNQVNLFLKTIPHKFVWQHLHLNEMNLVSNSKNVLVRKNQILPLNCEYASIRICYNENTRRNISKALKNGCFIDLEIEISDFIRIYADHANVKPSVKDLNLLKTLIEQALDRDCGHLVLTKDKQGNVLSGSFFLHSYDRLIYHTSFSTPEGQALSSTFLLMDETIKQYCGRMKVLDFEGSMIPGIARFFNGFGGIEQNYVLYHKTLFR